jgi:hypothetical protein
MVMKTPKGTTRHTEALRLNKQTGRALLLKQTEALLVLLVD